MYIYLNASATEYMREREGEKEKKRERGWGGYFIVEDFQNWRLIIYFTKADLKCE